MALFDIEETKRSINQYLHHEFGFVEEVYGWIEWLNIPEDNPNMVEWDGEFVGGMVE